MPVLAAEDPSAIARPKLLPLAIVAAERYTRDAASAACLLDEPYRAILVAALDGLIESLLRHDHVLVLRDLLELEGLFRRSEEFLGAQARQDLTRWGALTAYNLIQKNQDKYEKLVEAFKQKKSVAECVAAIEGR